MASDEGEQRQAKGGFFSRLLGRGRPAEEVPAPVSQDAGGRAEPDAEAPAATESPTVDEAPATEALDAASALAQGAPKSSEPAPEPTGSAGESSGPSSAEPPKQSWWGRLRAGLARSSSSLSQGIADIFAKKKLDELTLDELEDVLIRADLGVAAATRIRDAVGKGRYAKGVGEDAVRAILAQEVARALEPVATPLRLDPSKKPFVILVVGVNGSGKTTTIGKLAAKFVAEGHKVILAAGDTFRAAAIEQLQIWGARVGAEVVARPQGAEPASLAFDALKRSRADGADVLIVDTAGRLQNRKELMAELEKIVSVMKKIDSEAPHAVLLVLDATVGQNALNQVEVFTRVAGVTGLVMTKLDGTARGGILVAVADRFGLPIHFIGVGETVEDLAAFDAGDFARAIAGFDDALV
jgi:fused signal recognition particle receptor